MGCGPFFPNQLIVNGDNGVLRMPAGDFAAEMDRLCPNHKNAAASDPQSGRESVFQTSAKADEKDLQTALSQAGISPQRAADMVAQYDAARAQITANSQAVADNGEKAVKHNHAPELGPVAVPEELPVEFHGYLFGLISYHQGNLAAARAAWEKVLDLPAEQRRFRSTWAAFMLGKSYQTDDPTKARYWFGKTRDLAAAGFADSLDLAGSSWGWEAKADMTDGHFAEAMALYLKQYQTGDPTATMSLRDCARAVFKAGPDALAATARDGVSRSVITAYILCDAGPFAALSQREMQLVPLWLSAVDSANIGDMDGADRLAWAAYRGGDFDSAAHWVARAKADSRVTQWLRAKLLLRDGNVAQAAEVLAKLVHSFPPDDQWLSEEGVSGMDGFPDIRESGPAANIVPAVVGDLAVLKLARSQYVDSMDLLLRTDNWLDAAFVAERILTADELKAYVDRRFPNAENGKVPGVDPFSTNSRQNQIAESGAIRYLLARRLTRVGRWKEAAACSVENLGIRREHQVHCDAS